ncbi:MULTISPECIES: hypothetical protein [unclassified Nostoc]|uniref:hypothetical protein n=1 Tax=unclassified Nostoc TaxID=2593658 RepID=UPI002AD4410D|nr:MULTISPECIES: hypothetical protein [unclassified Nostoc]MDZ8126654.1 hypothetical protein [Nostoc sp. CmiVER01]MDZ8227878.1 hypothetical protein [Nostoc sp. ChiVER01]
MFIEFRNYTTCIQSNNLDSIELAITRILELEGCRRISQPPQRLSNEELSYTPWLLLPELWIVALFVGASGWTIVKTQPNELLCRRARGASRPRLSELAMQIDCNAFHFGAYGHNGILLEADAMGQTFISGTVDRIEEEENQFYEEEINRRERSQFFLLDMPEEIQAVVKPPSPEQQQEKDRRLSELDMLIGTEEEPFDAQFEIAELLKGHYRRIDEALEPLLGGSPSYWHLWKNNLFYLAYTQQQQLAADGARLLYFQPAEHYRQLDPLYEIQGYY